MIIISIWEQIFLISGCVVGFILGIIAGEDEVKNSNMSGTRRTKFKKTEIVKIILWGLSGGCMSWISALIMFVAIGISGF